LFKRVVKGCESIKPLEKWILDLKIIYPPKKNLEQIAKMFLIPNKWNFTKKLFVDDFFGQAQKF
jgi:hypothetical protein